VIAAAIAAFPAMTTPAAVAGGKAQPVPLSWPWYLLLVVLQMFGSISSNLMWVPQVRGWPVAVGAGAGRSPSVLSSAHICGHGAQCGFFAQVSGLDQRVRWTPAAARRARPMVRARASCVTVGCSGTYITMLNTVSNLGNVWPRFFAMWLVDTFSCGVKPGQGGACLLVCCARCNSSHFVVFSLPYVLAERTPCGTDGSQCPLGFAVDGYYVMIGACALYGAPCVQTHSREPGACRAGVLWLRTMSPRLDRLQSLDKSAWMPTASLSPLAMASSGVV
jgi:hypothetical protein